MAFRDLDEFLTVKPLVLPIGGKQYAFPGDVSGESWLLLEIVGQTMRFGGDVDAVAFTSEQETALKAEMFGATRDEMIADDCSGAQLDAVFQTLLSYHLSDRNLEVAEAVWNAQGQPPEVPAPNRAARRSKSTKATAKSTRRRGSTGGTTSAKTTPPAPAPPGPTSSSTGS